MTHLPTLTGQDIGQAENATRAVLNRLLTDTGTGFHGWVILNLLGTNDSTLDRNDLVARVVHGLKIDESAVHAALAELIGDGLVGPTPTGTSGAQITLTPAGSTRFQQITDGIRQITHRLYGGLPAEDLATAHRVLATVTERANTELAS
jgi:DNA-binding MarR family transcriptional regulator